MRSVGLRQGSTAAQKVTRVEVCVSVCVCVSNALSVCMCVCVCVCVKRTLSEAEFGGRRGDNRWENERICRRECLGNDEGREEEG